MARELDDHPLKQLDAALLVAPSPEAVARVRERVRQDQEAVRGSYGWWAVAAASVALLAVGIASWTVITSRHVATSAATVVATNSSTPVGPVAPAAVEAAPGLATRTVATADRRSSTARPAVVRAPARSRKAEVLVPSDERIALGRLLTAVREGRATVPPPGSSAAQDAEGHLLEPTPIDIPLIKIELLPGTPVAGSGGRVK